MGLAHKPLCDHYPIAPMIPEVDMLLFSTQIDPFQVDRQVGQFFLGEDFLIGIFDIVSDALGTFVVLFAVFHDDLAEHHIMLTLIVGHHLPLEQPLGEVPEMDHKPAEIQGIPVKPLLVEVLHHGDRSLDQVRDVVHFAHIGVQLGIDDVQGNEGCLVLVQCHPKLLPDDPQTMLSQMILRGVVAHDGAFQGIAELYAVGFALDGKADMVSQSDQQGFVELLGDLGLDMCDQGFRQFQMLHGDLFHQFPELSLLGLLLHAVGAFDGLRVNKFTPVPSETDATACDDQLIALFINNTQDIIIDEFFDPHRPRPLSDIKK